MWRFKSKSFIIALTCGICVFAFVFLIGSLKSKEEAPIATEIVVSDEQAAKKNPHPKYTYVEKEKKTETVSFSNEAIKYAELESSLTRLMEATEPNTNTEETDHGQY